MSIEHVATISLDHVVSVLRGSGVDGHVEQTGGGVATIYAGPPYIDTEGFTRYPAVAGPGWFEGSGFTDPRADLDEFCVGPDDDGETVTELDADGTVDQVASLITKQVKLHTKTI